MNVWSFTGRLTRDCEQRFLQSGKAVCNFSVAVEAGFGDNKVVNYPRCALFGARAEGQLPKYLVKGTQVAISGELRIREYDDKDGNKRTSVEVSVDKLDLIGGKQEASHSSSQQSPQDQQGNQNQGGLPSHGGHQQSNGKPDPFADDPSNGVPVDDDIPF